MVRPFSKEKTINRKKFSAGDVVMSFHILPSPAIPNTKTIFYFWVKTQDTSSDWFSRLQVFVMPARAAVLLVPVQTAAGVWSLQARSN